MNPSTIKNAKATLTLLFCLFYLCYFSQQVKSPVIAKNISTSEKNTEKKYNRIYQYGIIEGLIGGLYNGDMQIKELKRMGDFGLGAPDKLDGELVILNGKAYQTKSTGETVELNNDHKVSFAYSTFFKPAQSFSLLSDTDEKALYQYLLKILTNKNGIYSIKVTGNFTNMRTRAFPPVNENPSPKMADISDRQQFFDYQETSGTLVGAYFPNYLNEINVSGFHFHFLSYDQKQGGHLINFNGNNLKIEIAESTHFQLVLPTNKEFQNFPFNQKENKDLNKVEQGN